MKNLLVLAFVALLAFGSPAFAACSTSVPAGSIQIVDCNAESVVANSPYYSINDANALSLGFWFAWSAYNASLLSGVPVSGQVTITSGNPAISWPSHGLTAGSYIVLTTTYPTNLYTPGALPSNLTGSTFSAQTVYYVIAAGLTANAFEVSATPGGSAITPNASSTGTVYAFNLVAGFSGWANNVFTMARTLQQAAATPPPSSPAAIPLTPAQ